MSRLAPEEMVELLVEEFIAYPDEAVNRIINKTEEDLKYWKEVRKAMSERTSKRYQKVSIMVSYPAWSESHKSWHLLTTPTNNYKSWSDGEWFPKSICELERSKVPEVGILTLPYWLYEKKFGKKDFPPIYNIVK